MPKMQVRSSRSTQIQLLCKSVRRETVIQNRLRSLNASKDATWSVRRSWLCKTTTAVLSMARAQRLSCMSWASSLTRRVNKCCGGASSAWQTKSFTRKLTSRKRTTRSSAVTRKSLAWSPTTTQMNNPTSRMKRKKTIACQTKKTSSKLWNSFQLTARSVTYALNLS